ncbi:MAG: endolytic transglycosylase MltG [Mycolicibacterium insubricum]
MADRAGRQRAQPQQVGPPRDRMSRTRRARAVRNRRRRRTIGLLTMAMLGAVIVAGVMLGGHLLGNRGPVTDYAGDGDHDLLFEVHKGDTTRVIAQALADRGVIATTPSFMTAAEGNENIRMIDPGFYLVRTRASAASTVAALTDPGNRVGKLTVPEGQQLDDVTDLRNKKTTDGIFTLIHKASCYRIDGTERCVSVEDLRSAAGAATPEELKVPDWAVKPVTARGSDHRRLEGLIKAGTWQFNPTASAREVLASLVETSAVHYAEDGLLEAANTVGMTPYEVLTVASLVQKEANPEDFDRVSRVIYNRLDVPQKLQFDSTVNYLLDKREVATTDADRARKTPWNTYAMDGLPATPICSPGQPALTAAEHPKAGDWLYFVTVDQDGHTLFTRDYHQHLANIEIARRNGVLDSVR